MPNEFSVRKKWLESYPLPPPPPPFTFLTLQILYVCPVALFVDELFPADVSGVEGCVSGAAMADARTGDVLQSPEQERAYVLWDVLPTDGASLDAARNSAYNAMLNAPDSPALSALFPDPDFVPEMRATSLTAVPPYAQTSTAAPEDDDSIDPWFAIAIACLIMYVKKGGRIMRETPAILSNPFFLPIFSPTVCSAAALLRWCASLNAGGMRTLRAVLCTRRRRRTGPTICGTTLMHLLQDALHNKQASTNAYHTPKQACSRSTHYGENSSSSNSSPCSRWQRLVPQPQPQPQPGTAQQPPTPTTPTPTNSPPSTSQAAQSKPDGPPPLPTTSKHATATTGSPRRSWNARETDALQLIGMCLGESFAYFVFLLQDGRNLFEGHPSIRYASEDMNSVAELCTAFWLVLI